jgi:hypothetical protein
VVVFIGSDVTELVVEIREVMEEVEVVEVVEVAVVVVALDSAELKTGIHSAEYVLYPQAIQPRPALFRMLISAVETELQVEYCALISSTMLVIPELCWKLTRVFANCCRREVNWQAVEFS